MTEEQESRRQALALAGRVFDVEASEEALLHPDALWQELRARLAERIGWMLAHERYRLFGLLYRIDVREERVQAVLRDAALPEVHLLLADAVLDRMLEKVRIRRRYREEGGA